MRIVNDSIYFEFEELPRDITLQGVADLVAPHFGGDNAMHHYMIRDAKVDFFLCYTPTTTVDEGETNPFCSLNGWGGGDELLFDHNDYEDWDDEEALSATPEVSPRSLRTRWTGSVKINPWRMLNELRAERGLPKARRPGTKVTVTREDIKKICIQVWKDKYPRALTDADFVLGEFTAKLVEQEVERRIAILKGELVPLKGRK